MPSAAPTPARPKPTRLPRHRPALPVRVRRRRPPSATLVRRSARMTRSASSAICAPTRRLRRARSRRKCRCRTRSCRRPANAPARRAAVPTTRRRRCRSLRQMRGFRDIAADADDLGRAAATANRNARKTYANVPSPSPEFDRIEPGMENRGADPELPYSYDEFMEEADRYAAQPPLMPQPQPQRSRLSQDSRPRAEEAHPRSGRVSVQECDRDRPRADSGRRRNPVGQVGRLVGERPVQVVAHGGGSAKIHPRRSRSRRSPIASASPRRRRPSRRWRSAWCSMTRIRATPRASNMSDR